MGSYLSEPVTEKESTDESNDRLICGVSSMQGWRLSQEDAHNCILNYDDKTSFFAVYDGHGGQEVAQYCSDKLPQFIKETSAYKEGDMETALIDGFLGFDATIASPEVVSILKELSGDKEAEEADEDDEENVSNLYEEAAMPIEQVIEKYTSNFVNPHVKNLKKDDKFPKSPCLKAKRDSDEDTVGTSACSSSEAAAGSSSSSACGSSSSNSICNDGVSSSSTDSNEAHVSECKLKKSVIDGSGDGIASNGSTIPDVKISSADSSDTKEATPALPSSPVSSGGGGGGGDAVDKKYEPTQNGEVSTLQDSEAQAKSDVSSSVVLENGETPISKKGKGKAKMEIKTPKVRPKRNAQQLYKQWLDDFVDSDESDEEEDQTFHEPNAFSSSDDDDDEIDNGSSDNENDESVDVSVEADGNDESDEETSDDNENNDDDDDDLDDEDSQGYAFVRNMKEEPGSNSGCTAVVAVLKDNDLYVANAGDSRCIVCRKGEAIEMSFDHKPEDKPEMERVIKAGGEVTCDGRVNGGLNLSRAIGDHAYKQNKELSDREQMIIALPDVRKLKINPEEDEFMVLACDGIWNFMSSQQVVDFVRPRINEQHMKLSKICEALFDHCLAPCTLGDGTGCDNMTAIIVKFNKSNILKRSASTDLEENVKRIKTDESESQIDTTV